MAIASMNKRQRETYEMLLSKLDNIEIASDLGELGAAIVFDGDTSDGPCCGYIEVDGKVTWIAGG